MGRGKRCSPLQKKIILHSESFGIFRVQIFFEKSRNCPKKVTTNGFKCDIIHTSGTNKDFCTLLLNCLNCVLFVILCLLLTPLFYLFFHNTPFTVSLRAEVIFLPQFFLNCGIFFYMLYKPIKTGVMLLIQSLFAEGG